MRHAKPLLVLVAVLYWSLGAAGGWGLARWLTEPAGLVASQSQQVRARSSGVIYGDERLTQLVAVPREGLVAAQFWLLAHGRSAEGVVVLRVASPESPERTMATATVPLRALTAAGPVTFALPQFDQARTPALLLTLEAPDLDREDAPSVLGADNLYGEGALFVNDRVRPGEDLTFQLLSRHMRGDSLLPITRLAIGRPGILGWPPFYPLLLWAMLWVGAWALAQLLWAVARPGKQQGIQLKTEH